MTRATLRGRRGPVVWAAALAAVGAALAIAASGQGGSSPRDVTTPDVVLAWCDQGMRFMDGDYSEMMLQPPGTNLHAKVLQRGIEPQAVSSGVTVSYSIPGNTHSADKTNFWRYPQPALGTPAPNVGLTGRRLSGTLSPSGEDEWVATGIPVTPVDDQGRENPYPVAKVTVTQNGVVVAQTRVVMGVSTEINCNLCHNTPGVSTASDVLQAHDRLHGTNLMAQRPVLCASCHADLLLNQPGQPGVLNLSAAIHGSHAQAVHNLGLVNDCWACHPGFRDKHQRDEHLRSTSCDACHGSIFDLGSTTRQPWVDLPKCSNCHQRTGFDFEEAGKLYKNSLGHGGVQCAACHSSPHTMGPAQTAADNLQANLLQGHPGKIDTCTVCHTVQPSQPFPHRREF